MKKILHWLDENLEEFILVIFLIAMTLIMGIQVFARYALGASLSWSEELTRYLFIWSGFISVSYCTKKCISIKIEQFVAMFPRMHSTMCNSCMALARLSTHSLFVVYTGTLSFSTRIDSISSTGLVSVLSFMIYLV